MQTTIDRRTAIKITLVGAGAALLPTLDMAAEHAPCGTDVTPPFVAPVMCAELHIEDAPYSSG